MAKLKLRGVRKSFGSPQSTPRVCMIRSSTTASGKRARSPDVREREAANHPVATRKDQAKHNRTPALAASQSRRLKCQPGWARTSLNQPAVVSKTLTMDSSPQSKAASTMSPTNA